MNIESRIEFLANPDVSGDLAHVKDAIAQAGLKTDYQIISIAGTNGKGSVAQGLSYALKDSDQTVACFTSPHLFQFNERIVINGQPVSNPQLEAALDSLSCSLKGFELNYFQWAFLLALKVFEDADVSLAIFEVGLGGRLDSVNALDSDLSVLTSIDLDHTEILGNTRDEIALEKAPIGRSGKLMICGDENPPASLLQYCQDHQIDLRLIGRDFSKTSSSNLHPNNVAIILEVLSHLDITLDVPDLASVPILARQQSLKSVCPMIVDVAHNPAAVDLLLKRVDSLNISGRVHAVFSAKPCKNIAEMIQLARKGVDEWHIAPLLNEDSILDRVLADLARSNTNLYPSVRRAYEGALERCHEDDLLLCFGSFQVACEVLKNQPSYSKFNKGF